MNQGMTRSARVAVAGGLGLLGGGLLGLLAAVRGGGDDATVLWVVVFALVCGPAVAGLAWMLWLGRAEVAATDRAGRDDVERSWFERAASTAFCCTIGGALLFEGLGRALRVDWLAPVTIVHVLLLAGASFGLAYLQARRAEA
ncbi:hypothetical protein FB554_1933 [Barrientosiimonas humi]|uniref:DUF2178 domain-containing protein n=2 Tax=Barrientosiimonas humi TaxID=999931 RepID=A0A542XD64_9MICO|nr:hypothetical protein FB554_1933 [Barrientosiimonas humi]CAG7573770.1 hypothetical protein BH39T_PBIAJDOK_02408 [Barrientosiimonas humi]